MGIRQSTTSQARNTLFYLTKSVAKKQLRPQFCLLYKLVQQQIRPSWLYNIMELQPHLPRASFVVDDSIIYGAFTRDVGDIKHVCRHTLANLSNYYDNIDLYSAIKLCFVKHVIRY